MVIEYHDKTRLIYIVLQPINLFVVVVAVLWRVKKKNNAPPHLLADGKIENYLRGIIQIRHDTGHMTVTKWLPQESFEVQAYHMTTKKSL